MNPRLQQLRRESDAATAGFRAQMAAQAAAARTVLDGWLDVLMRIGTGLGGTVEARVQRRAADCGGPPDRNLRRAAVLVEVAMRWAHRLRQMLADSPARLQAAWARQDYADNHENLLGGRSRNRDPNRSKNAASAPMIPKPRKPHDELAGLAGSQIVWMICECLSEAAVLLGETEVLRELATIDEASRDMVFSGRPPPGTPCPWVWTDVTAATMAASAPSEPQAPDSG
jgi:hypothetical protein